jgi:hypothetical protein
VLRARLVSLGLAQSNLTILLWMSVIYGICLLVLYAVPKGMLLAPLGFVALHGFLFLFRGKRGG